MQRQSPYGATSAKITLRDLSTYVGLSPTTISAVLNRAPQARVIPQHTQERIFEAARRLNYRPNPIARALRTRTAGNAAGAEVDARQAVLLIDKEHLLRAIDAIRDAGLRVPGDVLVMGMDQPSMETSSSD